MLVKKAPLLHCQVLKPLASCLHVMALLSLTCSTVSNDSLKGLILLVLKERSTLNEVRPLASWSKMTKAFSYLNSSVVSSCF